MTALSPPRQSTGRGCGGQPDDTWITLYSAVPPGKDQVKRPPMLDCYDLAVEAVLMEYIFFAGLNFPEDTPELRGWTCGLFTIYMHPDLLVEMQFQSKVEKTHGPGFRGNAVDFATIDAASCEVPPRAKILFQEQGSLVFTPTNIQAGKNVRQQSSRGRRRSGPSWISRSPASRTFIGEDSPRPSLGPHKQ